MTIILTLGAVVFQGFEVPETIPFGGEQALTVHRLPGGSRVIDAMGTNDDDIPWSGRFRGYQAESRARILEGYKNSATVLQLTYSGRRYQVIVQRFRGDFQQQFEIPYSISVCVVSDGSNPILGNIPGIDQLIGTDLANAVTLGGAINLASINSAIGTVQTAISAVQTLKNAPLTSITGIASAIGSTQASVLSVATQAEAALAAAGVFTPGNSPTALVASLTAQSNGFSQLNNLYQMGATLSRMGKNLGS